MSGDKTNKKGKPQTSAFEAAWYTNCPKHKDVYGLFFRQCHKCRDEEIESRALAVLGPELYEKLKKTGLTLVNTAKNA